MRGVGMRLLGTASRRAFSSLYPRTSPRELCAKAGGTLENRRAHDLRIREWWLNRRGLGGMRFSTATEDGVGYMSAKAEEREIERFAVSEGIPTDHFGLYEILDSSKDMRRMSGSNCVLAVHGPEEVWLPKGREGHGSSGGKFAAIATSGTQFKVMEGDVLYTNRKEGEVNTQIAFDWVLAIGTFDWTVFGRPLIRQARVLATIEEQTRSGKVMVAKFKKRKGYLRRKGHRQPITRFKIDKIEFELPSAEMIKPYKVAYDPKKPKVPNHLRNL